MEEEQATQLSSSQGSCSAVQPSTTGADCFTIFGIWELQQRIVLMLKASSKAAILARFEREVAERKTVPRLFFRFWR